MVKAPISQQPQQNPCDGKRSPMWTELAILRLLFPIRDKYSYVEDICRVSESRPGVLNVHSRKYSILIAYKMSSKNLSSINAIFYFLFENMLVYALRIIIMKYSYEAYEARYRCVKVWYVLDCTDQICRGIIAYIYCRL